MNEEERSIIQYMVIVNEITPEAWLAITEADFNYDCFPYSFQRSRREPDGTWRIVFRSKEHRTYQPGVAFFKLLDGTVVAQQRISSPQEERERWRLVLGNS